MKTDPIDFDTILEFLEPWGPDLKNGLSNHAPMASEALYTLGKSESIFPWLEKYGKEFQKKKSPKGEIEIQTWKESLGKSELFPEWEKFFREQISSSSWQQILSSWVPNLAPGICADATHGVIRTGHAARSLGRKETHLRIGELASGLAVWASTYLELPSSYDSDSDLSPKDAIGKVPFVPKEKKKFSGTIVSSLEGLHDFPEFRPVIGFVKSPVQTENRISELTEIFSKVFLKNTDDLLTAIVFVHSVTSVSAFRNLLPYIKKTDQEKILQYSWQTSAALYSIFGKRNDFEILEFGSIESREEMIESAIQHGDEHVIKFTEVCLKEYDLNPSPVYLAAAKYSRKFLEPLV